ncbi:electron transfer flavoprotein subunit beta/FixA family protein [Phytoactinopolyspora halotolerans]|uniref:Electron transfer flavoprotein subunit beta/FixA family protein n=1 Tax=Phytoactinopolyspora halotolerans TaxID=1981512 RepID=A0A6L9SCS7_9ACTN|nr:electron transfer flavoprotein subunit beta/FixA family protein [Phytoactinopolyspora halotolerans]NEE02351.1 electron transfer flavoprotein subunit beta/FixA family protein [Phytoactinopolyspora halotolerans]
MQVLVCVKRVPASGGTPQLTDDGVRVDTRNLAFTVGPHEECAVEEAISLVATHGGAVTVLSVGPAEAEEQLRYAISMGADRGVLVDSGADELDPQATASALTAAIRQLESEGGPFDLIMFGNESPDAGNYQVGIRVACALGRAIVGGVKGITIDDDAGTATLHRGVADGVEAYEVTLPAAVAVKEGLNLPRYPSMRGRLRARKAELAEFRARIGTPGTPDTEGGPGAGEPVELVVHRGGLRKLRLRRPAETQSETVLLGHGSEAAPAVVDILEELDVV